jgi:hypothetical protein
MTGRFSSWCRHLAEGKIELENPDAKARKDGLRYAPSYIPGKKRNVGGISDD